MPMAMMADFTSWRSAMWRLGISIISQLSGDDLNTENERQRSKLNKSRRPSIAVQKAAV
jgi:hypothetical protein